MLESLRGRRVRRLSAALLVASPLAAASAQTAASDSAPPRVSYHVGGGFAQNAPIGGPTVAALGYAGQASVEVRTPARFLALRAEGLFADWGSSQRFGALTASVVAMPTVRWRAVPYLVAGGGAYALSRGGGVAPGYTLGVGLQVPLGQRAFFVESRLHSLNIGEDGVRRSGLDRTELGTNRLRGTATPLILGFKF
jgi:hypothetical protein